MGASRRINASGQIGPFEDLMSLIVVLIATGILVTSIVYGYSVVTTDSERAEFRRSVRNFLHTLRAYEGLTHDGIEGVFDGGKVNGINATIAEVFHPNTLGFLYNISIIDRSDYPLQYTRSNITPYSPPSGKELVTLYSSITIWASPNELHASQLVLICWRGSV